MVNYQPNGGRYGRRGCTRIIRESYPSLKLRVYALVRSTDGVTPKEMRAASFLHTDSSVHVHSLFVMI